MLIEGVRTNGTFERDSVGVVLEVVLLLESVDRRLDCLVELILDVLHLAVHNQAGTAAAGAGIVTRNGF